MRNTQRVLIVQRRMAHYRLPFFEALRSELMTRSVELVVANGPDSVEEATKGDSGVLEWAVHLPTKYFLGESVCWQPFGRLLRTSDMVVVTQENRLLYNLVAQYLQNKSKVGLWGHGANFQGDSKSVRERFKRRTAKRADWWFAYTQMSRALIVEAGFPVERISVVDNSVDTASVMRMRTLVDKEILQATRRRLSLDGQHVAIFVGSLYSDKRLRFLFDAADRIRESVRDFELIIIGKGPDEDKVRSFAATRPWVRYLGFCSGQDKINSISLARIVLNPGLVGLGLLDSFACGVPLLTTDCGLHSPEISYLESGANGILTNNSVEDFVQAAVQLLTDDATLAVLRRGCIESSKKYTLENMVEAFVEGIIGCLNEPPLR